MSDLTGKKCMQQKSFTYKFSCQIKVKVLWIVETDTQRTWTVNFADDLRLPTHKSFFFSRKTKSVLMYENVRENAWFPESDQTFIFDRRKFT